MARLPLVKLVRLLLLTVATASTLVALRLFYFRPWLGGRWIIDPWLDRYHCLFTPWCSGPMGTISQPGTLAVLIAVVCFALAFWRWPGTWLEGEMAVLSLVTPRRHLPRMAVWSAIVLAAAGFGVIVYQAQLVLAGGTPQTSVWLSGITVFVIAAELYDAAYPQDLARTYADVAVAIGMTVVILGVACVMAGRSVGVPLLLGGAIVFAGASWWTVRVGSSYRPVEHAVMLAFALLALVNAMSRAWSWRYAWIGDEWTFFNTARAYIHGTGFQLLGLRNPNDYHVNFSYFLQSWVMQLAGENMFGWRLASVLPFVLSVPPTYVFVRWLAGREAAFVSAGLLACSHVLLTFSMVPYNNTQALLPLTLGLGLFAFAAPRASVLRHLMLGMAAGMAVFVFGLARVTIVPIGIFLLAFAWPFERRGLPGWVPAATGALATSAPLLFSIANWRVMLKATPVQSEVASRVSTGAQMLHNAAWGLLAFLRGTSNTHYIAGPHADPLTASLMLAGLGYVLINSYRQKRARVWLLATAPFVLAVSAIQQYGYPNNTRMFILPPIYAALAGFGGAAIACLLLPRATRTRWTVVTAFVVVGFGLNLFHIQRISLRYTGQPVEGLVIQQLQVTGASDGGGMPAFMVMGKWLPPRDDEMARAYGIGRERLVFLTPDEALASPQLCAAGDEAAMLLVHAREAPVDALRARVAECWPGYQEVPVRNHVREIWLYRFVTAKGAAQLGLPPSQRHSTRQKPDTLLVPRPTDVVVDRSGTAYVLSFTGEAPGKVYRFNGRGRELSPLQLVQNYTSGMALTPDGRLLIASAGQGSHLVWYNDSGKVLARTDPTFPLGIPRGVAVASNGDIFVVDEAGGRVLHLSARAEIRGEMKAGGRLHRPCSIALAADGSLWVLNWDGELIHLSQQDAVLAALKGPPASPERAWRILPTESGDIIIPDARPQRLLRLNPYGVVMRVWSGLETPLGLTADATGRLFVTDWSRDHVAILPPVPDVVRPTATVLP